MFGAQIAITTIGSIFYLPFKTFFMKKIMITLGTCLLGALANNAQAQAGPATDVLQSSMTLNDAITLDVSAGSGGPTLFLIPLPNIQMVLQNFLLHMLWLALHKTGN